MLERVTQRLLGDAIYFTLHRRRRPHPAVLPELDLHVVHPSQHFDVLAQGRCDSVGVNLGRPQLEDERSHLLHRRTRHVAKALHLRLGAHRIALDRVWRRRQPLARC